ncbi:MAG: beta-ketoacyl synthase N-terminal-like domain-containing protein [Syntrophobacteraceae bacterium]
MKPRPTDTNIREEDRIVITGTGAVCSLGNSAREIRDALIGGKSGRSASSGFEAGGFEAGARAVNIPDIEADIHPRLAKSMGKHLSLLIGSAGEAYRHAGLGTSGIEAGEVGFFAGMGMVDYRVEDLLPAVLKSLSPEGELDYDKFFAGGYREIYPLWPLAMLNNVAFCQAAIHLGVRGENCVFAPHADAGVQAVAEAVHVLREGKARAVLAAGVGEEISALSIARAALNGMMNPANSAESAFLGECGAALVLEPLPLAVKRGARPIAGIAGFGFAGEKSQSGNCPTSRAVGTSIECALSAAGLQPKDIGLVIAGAGGNAEIAACEEAVAETFAGAVAGCGPTILCTGRVFGETFAAGPILNAIIGAGIFESSLVPPGLGGADAPAPGRILVIATSYEGRCGSLILEKLESP